MSSRKKFDAVATIGTYKVNGEEKKRYLNVGAVFEDENDGRLSMKLDAVPVSKDWSGWISFYEPQARGERPAAGRSEPAAKPQQDFDDDIPF